MNQKLFAVDADGKFYSLSAVFNQDRFFRGGSATLTLIGDTGSSSLSGLAFDPVTGKFWSGNSDTKQLISIDQSTAAATPEVTWNGVDVIQDLAILPDGSVYSSSHNTGSEMSPSVYSINRTTGASVELPGPLGYGISEFTDTELTQITANGFRTFTASSGPSTGVDLPGWGPWGLGGAWGGNATQFAFDQFSEVGFGIVSGGFYSYDFSIQTSGPHGSPTLGGIPVTITGIAIEPDSGTPENPIVITSRDSGPGSLREAVSLANPGATITFAGFLNSRTITLSGSEIALNKNLTIDASALPNGLTIDGGGNSRVFNHGSGSVVLQSLTIANGDSESFGGGIFSLGNLTINDCRLVSNRSSLRGGALASAFGSLAMHRTTVSGNVCASDAGLYIQDLTATISDSTISGNSGFAGRGLGVNATGQTTTVLLINSTVAYNATTNSSAGIDLLASSGQTCNATLTNCTVAKNSSATAGPGGISKNGGGSTSLKLMNSIVSGNTAGGAPADISGTAEPMSSFNLIGTGGGLADGVNGNQIGINSPLLGPLCHNGGPTFTMHPLPGSRAIDTGGAAELPEDQRGLPRLIGNATDIGSVESGSNIRWATGVLGFSSEYTPGIWSASQALGEPDTYPAYGDITTAWASLTSDSQREFLELGYDNFSPINAVSIYETLAPGAVDGISVRNAMTRKWVQVWSGTAAPAGNTSRIFTVTFPTTSFPVDGVRLDLNSPAVTSWNEIDAVSITPSFSVSPTPDLAAAFDARTVLTNTILIGGISVPASVSADSDGGPAVWEWTPETDGWYDINTFGSQYDTQVSVYEGSSKDSLIWIAGNDDAFAGEFASDHPQPDRSAMVLPFSAGKTYQIAISGGINGESGGSLLWAIRPDSEPLPPSVETRTHAFAFPPSEYNAATALINTIVPVVPIGGYGNPEPYVHVVDTRSAEWEAVVDGFITANPYLGVGSTIRTSQADQLSSQPRLSKNITPPEAVGGGGFVNPPSAEGPFITVVSARYPHRYGAGHQAICVDLAAQGGQGHGLTHMPKMYFEGDPTPIGPDQGGLIIDYHFQGAPPDPDAYGYSLKDPDNNIIYSAQGPSAEQLIAVAPGPYSICFDPVPGYRILVTQDGIPNIVEGGTDLTNISRDLCVIFPNSIDCSHIGAPNFVTQPVLAASECDVLLESVTTVNAYYIELSTGTDSIGYIDVPAPEQPYLQQTDILGEDATGQVIHPLVKTSLVTSGNAAQTKVLVMDPDETASVGRLVPWEKSAGWIRFRNFITTGDSSCYQCHTHEFGDPLGALDPVDGMTKLAGGRPRVPWFRVDPAIPKTEPFEDRIVPMDLEPYILGMFLRPFDKPLNHRMPIDIEANPPGSPARLASVEYAGKKWQILQDAGSAYDPIVTITGGNQVNLSPGTRQHTISFTAEGEWFAETVEAPWIHILGLEDGVGPGSLSLRIDPNPSSRPRMGIVQIEDVFFSVIQPIEAPEVISIEELPGPNRGYRFTFNTLNGVTYELEQSDSLAPGSWKAQGPGVVGVRENSRMVFDALFSEPPSRGFYRIRSSPADPAE